MSDPRAPRLARKARLKWDAIESRWMLLAPERGIALSASAAAILKRCDGSASIDAIAQALAEETRAPVDEVARDVASFVTEMHARGLVEIA
jgi:pyrroloquinoline quinone biosynthesis protein D